MLVRNHARLSLKSRLIYGLMGAVIASGLVVGTPQSAEAAACGPGIAPVVGDGSSANPYEIATAANLIWVSEQTSEWTQSNGHFRQTDSIDLGGCEFTPIGLNTSKVFQGSYDGGGFAIEGLFISGPFLYSGLFSDTNFATVFKNIRIIDVDVSSTISTARAGALVGRSQGDKLEVTNTFSSGQVSGSTAGGLIGIISNGNRDLVSPSISNSYSSATVIMTNDRGKVGGIVGEVATGLSGPRGTIVSSYSRGTVLLDTGLSTDEVGGLVGVIQRPNNNVADSFWDIDSSGQPSSPAGTGKSSSDMTSLATFNDTTTDGLSTAWAIVDGWEAFDFDNPTNFWGICSFANEGYPFLLIEFQTDPCVAPVSENSEDPGGRQGGKRPAPEMNVAPAPAPVAPQQVAPRAPTTPPAATTGPVLQSNIVPSPPQAPTALIGGVPTSVQQTVPDSTRLSLATGSVALDMTVANGSGARSEDGVTELGVKNGSNIDLAGSGLFPGSTVQVFIPLTAEDSREIAQLVVNPDGTFSGAATLSTDPLAAPLPIGPRLLQLVTIDEDGNQVVLEMTVAIEQGDPNPELNRELGDIPTMPVGSLEATSAGLPVEASITAVEDQKLAVVEGDGWAMTVNIDSTNGAVEQSETGALLKLVRDETAVVSGSGFMAGTRADVWLFSEPTLVGSVTIDENGAFTGEVDVDPAMIPAGEHTLQLQGVGTDGYVKAANLGVLVEDAGITPRVVEESSFSWGFLWWILLAVVALLILWIVVRRQRAKSRS